MQLFEDKIRTRFEYAHYSENTFNFYNSSGRDEFNTTRNLLNQWFAIYPLHEQNELRSRFQKTFSSAFFELFLYKLYSDLGCEIIIHPKIEKSEKHPDFLIKKGSLEFYLEAKEIRNKSSNKEAQINMENNFYDKLNQIDSPNFFLKINSLIIKSNEQPETKKLLKEIKDWIDSLSIEYIERLIEVESLENFPKFIKDDNKISLELTVLPKTVETRNKKEIRPIGAHPFHIEYDNTDQLIKKSIKKKADRYGKLDKPYIIAINFVDSSGIHEDIIIDALFGSALISSTTEKELIMRDRNGLIMGQNGPINRTVSAFQFMDVNPHNLHVAKYWIYKHPFASKPIDLKPIEMSHKYLDDSIIKESIGKTIKELLEIQAE